MKRLIMVFITVLAVMSMACNFSVNLPRSKVNEQTQTFAISEAYPDDPAAELGIIMGGGKIEIGPGSDVMLDGTVEFNVDEWKPIVNRSSRRVSIEQKPTSANLLGGGTINNWKLRLGNQPMDLTLEWGAADGVLDFSGVPLRRLTIREGASRSSVIFNVANPQEMDLFQVATGASNLSLSGLLHANFDKMEFKGGAGNFNLDFTGAMTHDVTVSLESGMGNITLVIPPGVNSEVNVSGGLNNVSTKGTWTIEGQQYKTIGTSGPLLKIDLVMGMGNLSLESE